MTIRRAISSDLQGVDKLLVEVDNVHHAGRPDLFLPDSRKYTDAELLEIFKDDEKPVFVCADENGDILGYAFCIIEHHGGPNIPVYKSLYLDDLCVDSSVRGKHIGSRLMEFVKAFASGIGCYNITLHVWECNPGARRFYESLGYGMQYSAMEMIVGKEKK
jgi:ribosomal protein S18 acetylase RimI-like enzyme